MANITIKFNPKSFQNALQKLKSFAWPLSLKYEEITNEDYVFCEGDIVGFDEDLFICTGQTKKGRAIFTHGVSVVKQYRFWMAEKLKPNRKSPLFKALGLKEGGWVIDATCGTGRDSAMCLSYSAKVLAFERNPKIYFLLQSSVLLSDVVLNDFHLYFGQYNPDILRTLDLDRRCPIYFDPMFDNGQDRKAGAKKDMALFHSLVGPDLDASEFATYLRSQTDRLVIKRAPNSSELLSNRNSFWESKAVRFDLYL